MHIFPYSIRPGTPAAEMSQVPGPVKEERAHRAGGLAQRLEGDYLNSYLGRQMEVLFEEERDGRWVGHTPQYLAVAAVGDTPLHNCLRQVRIQARQGEMLVGKVEL